jgi:hypothetical protein
MTWPFIQDGIPILYQGQEQGFTGGAEPSNREAYARLTHPATTAKFNYSCSLWPTAFQMSNKPLVTHVTTLNAVRKAAAAANSSFLTTPVRLSPLFFLSFLHAHPHTVAKIHNPTRPLPPCSLKTTPHSAPHQPGQQLHQIIYLGRLRSGKRERSPGRRVILCYRQGGREWGR